MDPVCRSDDGLRIIRPDQIAEPGVVFPDWPRADLNIACLELLIGLVFLTSIRLPMRRTGVPASPMRNACASGSPRWPRPST